MRRQTDARETRSRLLEWDKGQAPSERLASIIIATDGFSNIDPSHPLGGKDGKKDGFLEKDDSKLILAVHFPRGQQSFLSIKKKFEDDIKGVKENHVDGIVFVTNQELRLNERNTLQRTDKNFLIEIYHLERLTTLLHVPENYGTRLEFLDIEMTSEELIALYSQRDKNHLKQLKEISELLEKTTNQLIGYSTGGNSYPHVDIDSKIQNNKLLKISIRVKGEFPLFDVKVDINYLFKNQYKKSLNIGNLTPNFSMNIENFPVPDKFPAELFIRIFAKNGVLDQSIIIDEGKNGVVEVISTKIVDATKWRGIEHAKILHTTDKLA